MKPVGPNVIDALRVSGIALGGIIAAVAIYQYMRYSGRPDAAEMRDLWLIVAAELATVPIALSFLLPRQEPQDGLLAAPATKTRTSRVPNPWAY